MPRRIKETGYDEAVELSSVKSPALIGDERYDPDLDELNDPDMESLGEPPLLGVRPKASDLFGEEAQTFGRATSPKLYAQAAQFPTAVQFRAWRWENGVPVALGAIDAEATEEDFVRQFFDAMPAKGDGKFQYRLRPIDIRGKELGKEFTINISEHHSTLARIRRVRAAEAEGGGQQGRGGDVHVHGGGEAGQSYAEEMGRMFESAVDSAERRTELLQHTLEEERDSLRAQEKQRAEERVATAERSATVVQQMTEKLMETDRVRSAEAMQVQKAHSGVMMDTMTTVFQQQQEAQRQQAERMRGEDSRRQGQDREFYERQRQEGEGTRVREREDWERRREEDRHRMQAEQEQRDGQRKFELEQMKIDADRRKAEDDSRMERERVRMSEDRERWRQEAESRRAGEQRDWEKKRDEEQRRRDIERQDWERRETLRREEISREQDKRREEMGLQTKAMEMSAQRDREHSERMMEMARLERETQRDAQSSREKIERESREIQDKDRQRQHEMALREMEMAKDRDREHQERMMKLSSGGMGGLKDMLGMETPELLSKIFGTEEGGGWSDAIPKVLGSIAEMGKVAMASQAQAMEEATSEGARPPRQEPQVAIQTPEGIRMIPASVLARMQADMQDDDMVLPDLPMRPPGPPGEQFEHPVPTPPPREEPVNTLRRAKEAGLDLTQQRGARRALRELAGKLASAPEEEWLGLITLALTEAIDIYHYIRAVTVEAAFAETQADSGLVGKVIAAMKESGLVPEEVPYTEADFAALSGDDPEPEAAGDADGGQP